GSDPLFLGHANQLAQEQRPQQRDARGPEIDGEELQAAVGGQAHAAVEGPRRAVHGRREDVGDGADAAPAEAVGEGLARGGDEEEEDQVAEKDGEKRGLAHPAHSSSSEARRRNADTISTTTMPANTANRWRARAGTPRMSTGRLAMARSGQSRHAPKRAKQATRSSGAFIGLRNYRRVGRGHATRGRWGRRTAGGGGSVAPGQEALGEQGLKGLLELRGPRVCHLVGPSRSLHPLAVS